MTDFLIMTLTPPGYPDPSLAIAGCRAGALGVLNLQYCQDIREAQQSIQRLAEFASADFGLKLDGSQPDFLEAVLTSAPANLKWVVLAPGAPHPLEQSLELLTARGLRVLLECTSLKEARWSEEQNLAGVIAKGCEAGGRIGRETTFILVQKLTQHLSLPVYAQGGIGLHTAAACYAAGAAGVALDSQLALTRESPLSPSLKNLIRSLDGTETVCLGEEFGEVHRLLSRCGLPVIKELRAMAAKNPAAPPEPETLESWRQLFTTHVGWQSQEQQLLLWGQDLALAAPLAKEYLTVGGIVQALRRSLGEHVRAAQHTRPAAADAPLAQAQGTQYPLIQGPMARVSDTPAFALAVAQGGALPFVAAAWMQGPELQRLLMETKGLLEDRPWGVGLLGFLDPDHYRRQMEVVLEARPPFALIAGGHPEQVKALEQAGIATYIHVPSPGLLRMFLERGLKRFVLEGRESGGHIGPLCSFILWELALNQLLGSRLQDCQILFAGGIHDSLSAAMVAVMAAPLAAQGVQIGLQLGTAYLFTQEAVATGALAPTYQQEAIRGDHTRILASGPGHAERCLDTPFIHNFQQETQRLRLEGRTPEQVRQALDHLKLGRLRVAAKGVARNHAFAKDPQQPEMLLLNEQEQLDQGIYLIGQLVALRDRAVTIPDLHYNLAVEGSARVAALASDPASAVEEREELPSDVAIIGMDCLLPQARSPAAFWENILNKVDALKEIPAQRWDWRRYYDADQRARDKICSKWGAFLEDIPFDPTRYGITPNSLPSIESLQLLALEVSRRALKDAGYSRRPFARSRTSVILGISGSGDLAQLYNFRTTLPMMFGDAAGDLIERLNGILPEWTEDSFPGILMNVAAGRIANRFDLGGVNCTVDAACASSLAALYLAVRELEARTSDMVIVGGADCMQNPFTFTCFSKTHALSTSSRSQALDAKADGIALGEGVVVMILKRLAEAERDGDRIYAVIKSVAASSDGRGKSLTAPGREGQVRVLTRAYRKAGFSPTTVGLMEAHATGTAVGDRTEIEALSQVFSEAGAQEQSCALGSVKSMIGHTKAAAGLASLMKTSLALHHKVLPPTLGVEQPNPALALPGSPLYVNTRMSPWIAAAANPRRAGVSALGFGGANFHVVLEEYRGDYLENLKAASFQTGPGELLLWRRESPRELAEALNLLEEVLRQEPAFTLADLAHTLAGQFAHGGAREGGLRLALVATSWEDLRTKLLRVKEALKDSSAALTDPKGIYLAQEPLYAPERLAFLFPGQGSQYLEMLADLSVQFPEIREELEQAEGILGDRLPRPLSSYIFPPPVFTEEDRRAQQQALVQTTVAQPALGAVDLAMYKLLKNLGIVPAMLAGHSYGEYVALTAAGVFPENDLPLISEARARFILEETAGDPGAMAAVQADVQQLCPCLEGLADVWVANVNSPVQTVITGTEEGVAAALKKLHAQGLQGRAIPVSCAFHSPLVQAAAARLEEFLASLKIQPPQIQIFSNTTAAPYPQEPQEIISLLGRHQVRQVQFVQEVEAMYAAGARIFVEVGPGRVLTGLVQRILGERPHLALASNQSGRSGLLQLLHLLGQLAVQGAPVKLDRLFQGREVRTLDLKHAAKIQAQPLPATTWLVNGSRARPLNEAASPQSRLPVALPALSRPAQDPAAGETSQASGAVLEKVSLPADPAGSPAPGADQVMVQYQRLSQRFLEMQKRVMLNYLGKPHAAAPVTDVRMPSPSLPEQKTAPAPPLTPAPVEAKIPSPSPAAPETPAVPQARPQQDLTESLLEIVAERTGYPREMLALNLDLEADLGIDSIKRMEILGHFLQVLFPQETGGPPQELAELAGVKTLGEIVEAVASCGGKAAPEPAEIPAAPASPVAPAAPEAPETLAVLPRFILQPVPAPEPAKSLNLASGRVVLITDDRLGVAARLQEQLQQQGVKSFLVPLPGEVSPSTITPVIEKLRQEHGAVGGLVHLLPLRPGMALEQLDFAGWRRRLREDIGALFLILQELAPDLKAAAADGGAWVVAATGLGGRFACDPEDHTPFFPGQGGVAGLLKTLALEWPEVKVKSVDLVPGEPPATLAAQLLAEIEAADQLVEVGYHHQERLTLGLIETPLPARKANDLKLNSSSVILVTGGARGITAAVTRELARKYRPRLLLSGKSPAPAELEAEETAGLSQPQVLKTALIAQMRRQGQDPKLPEVEARYLHLLKEREMRANLAALEAAGARVEYLQADVRDPEAFGNLLDQVYTRYGRLDGMIHGAGIIEDKLLADKSWESFLRVFGTKTESAFILSRKLQPATLEFLIFFSSVAGRFGSRGQADYTAANEVYNKLASYLDRQWPGRVAALNWGPWKTAGMASEGVQRQFAERGVGLIEPPQGAKLFDLELHRGHKGEAEVIVGEGPWRQLAVADPFQAGAVSFRPLLQQLTTCRRTDGRLELVRHLDPRHDLYLQDHRLDSKPVLPAAVAMEFMAEAARQALPEWRLAGLKEVRVLKGVVLENSFKDILVQVNLPAALTDPLEVETAIKDPARPEMTFYRGRVMLSRKSPVPDTSHPPAAQDFQPLGLTMEEAYRRFTFHGPLFQGIKAIQGISDKGLLSTIAPSSPRTCFAGNAAGEWLLDPIAVDSGLQLGLIWWRTYLDVTPLPTCFEEIRLYQPLHRVPELTCYYEVLRLVGQQTMFANIYYWGPDGELLALIKGFESTGSKALNRLAGSHLLTASRAGRG